MDIALFMTSKCPLLKFSAEIIYRFFLVTLFGITLNQGNLFMTETVSSFLNAI